VLSRPHGDPRARQQRVKLESTPTLFVNGKMMKGGTTIEHLDKEMAPYLKS
jgi:protein-disulfide isomerase